MDVRRWRSSSAKSRCIMISNCKLQIANCLTGWRDDRWVAWNRALEPGANGFPARAEQLAPAFCRTGIHYRIPDRRLGTMQVVDEKVPQLPVTVGRTRASSSPAVFLAGHNEQVERLVRLDQRVHYLHRRRRVDVGVEFGQHQEEFALQLVRMDNVGAGFILRPDGISHPLFVPPDLVHAVVVAAGERHGDMVELGMVAQRTLSDLSYGRSSV